jgi:hypothetical protein
MIVMSEAENFPLIVKMSSNEKEMTKQCKVFSRYEKIQILAKGDDHMGTWVDLVAMLGLLVSTLNTIVNKGSEIQKSYLCYKLTIRLKNKTWTNQQIKKNPKNSYNTQTD